MQSERFVELCAVDELASGEIKAVVVPGGLRIAVYNVEGQLYATDDTCSHGNASLADGMLEGCHVICPFHLGAFDVRNGCPVGYPVTVPIKSYEVVIRDGKAGIMFQPEQ
jgi:nitrite reductase/ring-hydroxylating ferredoxin subunit